MMTWSYFIVVPIEIMVVLLFSSTQFLGVEVIISCICYHYSTNYYCSLFSFSKLNHYFWREIWSQNINLQIIKLWFPCNCFDVLDSNFFLLPYFKNFTFLWSYFSLRNWSLLHPWLCSCLTCSSQNM